MEWVPRCFSKRKAPGAGTGEWQAIAFLWESQSVWGGPGRYVAWSVGGLPPGH